MHFKENTILALNGIRSNKMRSILTMLGIIIGIASVITIVTVGNSMTNSISSALNDMGANSIEIYVTGKSDENGTIDYNREKEEADLLSDEMIKEDNDMFSDKIDAYATSVYAGEAESTNGRNKAMGTIIGTNAGALKIQNIDIVAGHSLNEREVSGIKNVVVISDKFAEKLFPGTPLNDILSKEIKVKHNEGQNTFNVVGIYHYEVKGFAANMVGDTTTDIFVPIGVAKKISNQKLDGYRYIQIRGNSSVTDCELFSKQTADFFNKRYYRSNKYFEVQSQNYDSMIKQSQSMMDTMKLAIGLIAGISLLEGGIGVMNIMMVSVTERTREIGTRKAISTKNSAIRVQFIMEAVILCLIGGIVGILLGTALGYIGSNLLGQPTFPDLKTVLIAVGFSMAIGIFFGYYPANKAAKLNPIEALRYE